MKKTLMMSLMLMGMLFLAGLTGCEQAEKAIESATESAQQTADAAKSKAIEILGGTEKKEPEGQPLKENEEEKDEEGEKKE